MEKYTIEEKQILIEALDQYITIHNRPRPEWLEPPDGVITIDLTPLKELWAKLILEISPIKIKTEDMGNKNVYDSWYFYCHLCGKTDRFSFPENPVIDNHHICSECFKKYEPELYKKTMESNKVVMEAQL